MEEGLGTGSGGTTEKVLIPYMFDPKTVDRALSQSCSLAHRPRERLGRVNFGGGEYSCWA